MTPTKQTVYLPVKIDDEFWTKWDNGEKPDYDLADVETGENIESWVNEKEGYFFTPEQLNELLSDVIKDALNTAAENAYVDFEDYDKEFVNKKSITNTFEEIFQKYKV